LKNLVKIWLKNLVEKSGQNLVKMTVTLAALGKQVFVFLAPLMRLYSNRCSVDNFVDN
jgi:hypothetical protein